MASVNRPHAGGVKFKAAYQVRRRSFAFHQTTAAWFHFTSESFALFPHHVGASFKGAQIFGPDALALLRIAYRTPEPLLLAQGLVVDDQAPIPSVDAEHPDSVRGIRFDRIRLFKQKGAWRQLGQRPELDQDVGV
jgi:hypothetical protein